ncbi:MAG: hypothetical protein Kow00121_63300 [Elainellaceae cyanobacterium]
MTTSDKTAARFRSATEFPKQIENLNAAEIVALYGEMRECLIFTNRSRAQLIRRNEEHKQSALQLKTDVERLQTYIHQLKLEKEEQAGDNRRIISALEQELGSMAGHLDKLSDAFDTVSDLDNPQQSQWGFLATPGRFFSFLRAIKAIVLWWREERDDGNSVTSGTSSPQLPGDSPANLDLEDDRRMNPQMYTDSASQGRSLLDR